MNKNKVLYIVLFTFLIGCSNSEVKNDIIDKFETISSYEPSLEIKEEKKKQQWLDNWEEKYGNTPPMLRPEKSQVDNEEFNLRGWNESGDLGGQSLVDLYVEKDSQLLKIVTLNTTGSVYTGNDRWEDTYYLTLDDVFTYEKSNYYGIGMNSNLESKEGTIDYTGNIKYFTDRNCLQVQVFSDNWNIYECYYFENIDSIKSTFDEIYTLTKELQQKQKPFLERIEGLF